MTNEYKFFLYFAGKHLILFEYTKIGSSSTDLPGDLNVNSQRNRVESEAKVGKLLLKVLIYTTSTKVFIYRTTSTQGFHL